MVFNEVLCCIVSMEESDDGVDEEVMVIASESEEGNDLSFLLPFLFLDEEDYDFSSFQFLVLGDEEMGESEEGNDLFFSFLPCLLLDEEDYVFCSF